MLPHGPILAVTLEIARCTSVAGDNVLQRTVRKTLGAAVHPLSALRRQCGGQPPFTPAALAALRCRLASDAANPLRRAQPRLHSPVVGLEPPMASWLFYTLPAHLDIPSMYSVNCPPIIGFQFFCFKVVN